MGGDITTYIVAYVIADIIFALLGIFIATQKNRAAEEGFFLGLLFGPFGCLVEALLPTLPASTVSQASPGVPAKSPEELELERKRQVAAREKYREKMFAEHERIRLEAQAQRDALAAMGRGVAEKVSTVWSWFAREVIQFGWYRRLPSIMQPIVLGIGIAIPAVIILSLMFNK